MKKLLLLLLLFPAFTFAQSLTGKWAMKDDAAKTVEFKADGTMDFVDPEVPEGMGDITVKYSQVVENGIKYLVCDVYMGDEKMESQKNVYKVEGDTLTIVDNADETEPGKSPDNVFYRVKQ